MLNAGKVTARPTSAELGLTSTGKEQIGIAFEILDGPDAGQGITAYRYFSDAAVQYALKDMRTCGWTGDDVSDLSSIGGPDAPNVQLVIEHEEYEGKTSAKVKWINPLGMGGVQMNTVLDASQRTSFAARMRGKVAAFNATEGKKPAAPPAPQWTPPPTRRTGALPPEPPPYGIDDAPPPGFDE